MRILFPCIIDNVSKRFNDGCEMSQETTTFAGITFKPSPNGVVKVTTVRRILAQDGRVACSSYQFDHITGAERKSVTAASVLLLCGKPPKSRIIDKNGRLAIQVTIEEHHIVTLFESPPTVQSQPKKPTLKLVWSR